MPDTPGAPPAGRVTAAAVAAAVLAGGRSVRMGRDKAFLARDGIRLIDRQVAVLAALQPAELVISGRAGVDYGRPQVPVVLDRDPDNGPLAGLCAVFAATHAPLVLIVAVDLPAIDEDLLRRLLRQCRREVGVVPVLPTGPEPLVAVYARRSQVRAEEHLRRGRRAMREFVHAAAAAGELTLLPLPAAQAGCFANWNHPGDLPSPPPGA